MEYLRNKKLVVGVSGGPDSVYLLDVLAKEKLDLIVAHFNHGIRGKESDLDEKFVEKLAKEYGYPFESEKVTLTKDSEEKARDARYKFLREIKTKYKADMIIVAHTLDDNIETVLLNIVRGCGIKGMSGMQTLHKDLMRPLLETPKKEILKYLKLHKLPFRIDKSNSNPRYTRNFIRRKVIPNLTEINPNLLETIGNNLSDLHDIEDYIKQKSENLVRRNFCLNKYPLKSFQHLHPALRKSILMRIFQKLNRSTADITSKHIKEILSIIMNGHGRKHKTFQNIRIEILNKSIVFSRVN